MTVSGEKHPVTFTELLDLPLKFMVFFETIAVIGDWVVLSRNEPSEPLAFYFYKRENKTEPKLLLKITIN